MDPSVIIFYGLASLIIFFALSVVISSNTVYSAFYLAITMIGLSFVYFLLQAHFIAGVQLIVYSGAVMVLFVMVLMMFDLKKEKDSFSKGRVSNFLKVSSVGWLWGLVAGAVYMSSDLISLSGVTHSEEKVDMSVKGLAKVLYTDYLFSFELLGILLLAIAVGAVTLSRIKGGTHV